MLIAVIIASTIATHSNRQVLRQLLRQLHLSFFSSRNHQQVLGFDATPNYLLSKTGAEVMQNMYGQYSKSLKFLVILRDPTDRLLSYFNHFQPELNFEHWVTTALDAIDKDASICEVLWCMSASARVRAF